MTCISLVLQTKGSYDFKLESYESYEDYVAHTMKATFSRTTVTFGLIIPGVFELGFNYDESKYKKSEQKIRNFAGRVKLYTYTHTHSNSHSSHKLLA